MSISVSLPDRYNNPLHLDNLLYAADGNNNMAATSNSTAMSLDGQLPSSIIQTLGQSFDGKSDNSKRPTTGLQGYGAIQPVQSSDDNSLTDSSSPSNSFKLSPSSPISNYTISPNDLGDAKNVHDAPQTAGDETAVDGSNGEMKTPSKPRTRRSTGSSRRRSQPQTQAQTQTPKQKQQPAALKSKISLAKSKASNDGYKPQPRTRSLERNRIAASRCRQKKKEWLSGLEAKKPKLEKQYKSLQSEYNELLDEVTQLKSILMIHAGCNDQNIDGWINNEANTYIRRLSHNANPQSAAAATSQADQNVLKDTDCLVSSAYQDSNFITPSENSGLSNEHTNEYVSDGMFDQILTMGQSVTAKENASFRKQD